VLRRAAAACLPSLLLLLLLEGGARLLLPALPALDVIVASPVQRGDFEDEHHVRIFEGDPLLFWRLQPSLDRVVWDFTMVSTSAQGLRHPRPVENKRPGSLRIVTFGDSVTFGYRVPLSFPDSRMFDAYQQPYPRLLESALRRTNEGREVEVVSLAVPGYSSHQGAAWARRDLRWMQPDLVTWCFGWNDVSMRPVSDAEAMRVDRTAVAVRALGVRSQAFLHAAARLRRAQGEPRGPQGRGLVPRVDVAAYVGHARELAALARAAGAVPLVIGPVYRDATSFPEEAARMRAHRDALRSAMEAEGVPYVEIPELMEGAAGTNAGLFGELIHPNAAGHRVMANAILADLARARRLPGWIVPVELSGADPVERWP
jgi:lysophospholipase L1-like esterase